MAVGRPASKETADGSAVERFISLIRLRTVSNSSCCWWASVRHNRITLWASTSNLFRGSYLSRLLSGVLIKKKISPPPAVRACPPPSSVRGNAVSPPPPPSGVWGHAVSPPPPPSGARGGHTDLLPPPSDTPGRDERTPPPPGCARDSDERKPRTASGCTTRHRIIELVRVSF
jgi:hypothetical protein